MMKQESGRSMVEMLGVLAIIGVLSIGGIAGYTIAMNRYRANEILDMAAKVSVLGMAASADGSGSATMQGDLDCNNVHGVTEMSAGSSGAVTLEGSIPSAVSNAMRSIAGDKWTAGTTNNDKVSGGIFDPTKAYNSTTNS